MKILKVPNPKLNVVCTPIEQAEPISLLINSLKKTFEKSHGVGLAAPQIGYTRRVFIARIGGKNQIFINPVVTAAYTKGESIVRVKEKYEGCLSIPGKQFFVPRYESVYVAAEDERRVKFRLGLEGDDARVVQHENDHLDGLLISRFKEYVPEKLGMGALSAVIGSDFMV